MPVWLQAVLLSLAALNIGLPFIFAHRMSRDVGWGRTIMCGMLVAAPGLGIVAGFLIFWMAP